MKDKCDAKGYYGNHIWKTPIWISVENGSGYWSGKVKQCEVCHKQVSLTGQKEVKKSS